MLNTKRNWIAEYTKLKSYVPHSWLKVLKGEEHDFTENSLLQYEGIYFNHNRIFFKGKQIPYKKLKQKELCFKCVYPAPPPTSLSYWENIFEDDLDVNSMFAEQYNILCKQKVLDFHWKVLHHAVFSEMRLKQMKKSNGKCKSCIEDETVCHLLYDCIYIKPTWNYLENVLNGILNINFRLSLKYVIFGVDKNCLDDSVKRILCNFLIFSTKWCIWKRRNYIKYDSKTVTSQQQIVAETCSFWRNELLFIQNTSMHTKLSPALKSRIDKLITNVK